MKKIVLAVLVLLLNAATARSAEPYLEEVKALGIVSGQGLACGASKFDTFEMLARAILITKASSDRQQAEGMRVYNEAKADAYISKQMDGFFECAQINRRFDNQLIFRATLYADGTIKMPDGQIFTPRNPYDATLVYKKGDNGRSEAERIYKKRQTDGFRQVLCSSELTVLRFPIRIMCPGSLLRRLLNRQALPALSCSR